jgi:uncharacterized protein
VRSNREHPTSQQGNLRTIRGVYDAYRRGDVEAILPALTDDVDWAADGAVAPWHGRRNGKAEVARFFGEIAATIQILEFTPLAVAASNDGVFAVVRVRFRALATGREAVMNLHHYFGFREGKIEFYRVSEDTAQTASVLGELEERTLSDFRSRARTSASVLRRRG